MAQSKKVSKLAYYIFAFLVAFLILVLWQGFREKPASIMIQKENPFAAPTLIGKPETLSQKIFFASNGKDTAYKIKKGDKWTVIFKGVEGNAYDFVSNPVFSADGSQLAYSAEVNNQAYVVVNNNQEIFAYQKAGFIVFSPDGSTIAFVAAKSSIAYIIVTAATTPESSEITTVQGTETQEYEQIGTATTSDGEVVSIIFSSDGEDIAYIIEKDGGVCVVVNGEEGEVYDSISNISINDDGEISYEAQDGNETILIVDDSIISTNTSTTSTSTSTTTDSTNDDSSTSSSTSISTDYKYKISTDKDIDRSTSSDVDYSNTCVAGQTCNF